MMCCQTLQSDDRRLHNDHATTLHIYHYITLDKKGTYATLQHTLDIVVTIVVLAIHGRKDYIL